MGAMKELFYQDKENSADAERSGLTDRIKNKFRKMLRALKKEFGRSAEIERRQRERHDAFLRKYYDRIDLK
jgi:hypothetical protein